ncbi:MAG: YicC family protein [Candidatus Zixiibacteriota bacterium]|nr:MAG: YicC family protein [candidate division Zixibacteria bacterium]
MYSMTGFGRADLKTKQIAISVEASSVNNRYLECIFRLPRQLAFLEPRLKELVCCKLQRGRINIAINYEDYGFGIDKVVLNKSLADDVIQQLASLKRRYKLSGEIDIGHFLAFPDLFKVAKAEDLEKKVWPLLKRAVTRAIDEMIAMRKREGANLKKDINSRLNVLLQRIGRIEKLANKNFEMYRDKLARRINELLNKPRIDQVRLEEEVAYMTERADISEECVRFISHLRQFQGDIRQKGAVGRRLNFILQELNREVNTIGAKSANPQISHLVVELKEEIERIREQVQNIE